MSNKKLTKSALFGDIHFGGKSNNVQHNEDCIAYIMWFCEQVKNDDTIDHVVFLGDWNQERSAIDILTLNYSHQGALMLNALGIPIYFILGNHDLYKRHSRSVHSIVQFENLENFIPVYEPTVFSEIGNSTLLCPFLFHDEYVRLTEFSSTDIWFGHFEFSGFVITGYSTTMKGGPNPDDFNKPTHILSGHFHKRQTQKNITYIGNCFPSSFGDAGDVDRGMATFDHTSNTIAYINWPDCPRYEYTTLSELVDNPNLPDNAHVKCTIDIPIEHSDSIILRRKFMSDFNLRSFTLDESSEIAEALAETTVDDDIVEVLATNTNDMICEMLSNIETDQINNDLLITLYQDLKSTND